MAESVVLSDTTARLSRGCVDRWLESHIQVLAIAALASGFIIRVVVARSRYLVADEALDYLLINQPSVFEAYRASLTQAHPPLFYFVLYYWRFLGTSELMLRLPSVIAGTLMPWFAFLWLKRLGKATAFLALLLLTFSPALIGFSVEVRPYALLLLFLTVALWKLECGFEKNSAGDMLLFGLFVCLAIFTQYSAIWVAAAIGVYALVRMFLGELRRSAIVGWIASQACALIVLGFLWVTHISTLHNSAMESAAINNFLRAEYFQPGEKAFGFVLRGTANAFFYLLTQRWEISPGLARAGIVIALFFLFAIAVLVANRSKEMELTGEVMRNFGLLMLLPFVVGCAGALLRFYPYGASRHVAYLAAFAMGGIAFGIAWLSKRAFWAGIAATAALLIACNAFADPTEYMSARDQGKEQMAQAVKYIDESVPAGGVIVVDYNTSLVMRYYLCSGKGNAIRGYEDRIRQFGCGKYQMASGVTRDYNWVFSSENFGPMLAEMKQRLGWRQGQDLWLVRADEIPIDAAFLARFGAEPSHEFGDDILVTRLRAP